MSQRSAPGNRSSKKPRKEGDAPGAAAPSPAPSFGIDPPADGPRPPGSPDTRATSAGHSAEHGRTPPSPPSPTGGASSPRRKARRAAGALALAALAAYLLASSFFSPSDSDEPTLEAWLGPRAADALEFYAGPALDAFAGVVGPALTAAEAWATPPVTAVEKWAAPYVSAADDWLKPRIRSLRLWVEPRLFRLVALSSKAAEAAAGRLGLESHWRRWAVAVMPTPGDRHPESPPRRHNATALFQSKGGVLAYFRIAQGNYMLHREAFAYLRKLIEREVAPTRPGYSALDLACGDAYHTARALQDTGVGRYTGVDASAEMLALATRNVRKRLGDAAESRFPQTDFLKYLVDSRARGDEPGEDVIVISYSLHHLAARRKRLFFSAARAALRAGGIFVLVDPICADGLDRGQCLERMVGYFNASVFPRLRISDAERGSIVEHIMSHDYPETRATYLAMAAKVGLAGCHFPQLAAAGTAANASQLAMMACVGTTPVGVSRMRWFPV